MKNTIPAAPTHHIPSKVIRLPVAELREPINPQGAYRFSFYEAMIPKTEINTEPKRIVAWSIWDIRKAPYQQQQQPVKYGIGVPDHHEAQAALANCATATRYNKELIVFTDGSGKLVINAHVTLHWKPKTFLVSPSEYWRFQ